MYTKPGGFETGTDIITGEQSKSVIPETRVYVKNGDSLLTKSSTYRVSKNKAVEYQEIGKIDRSIHSAESWVKKNIKKCTPKFVKNGMRAVNKWIKNNVVHSTTTTHQFIDR